MAENLTAREVFKAFSSAYECKKCGVIMPRVERRGHKCEPGKVLDKVTEEWKLALEAQPKQEGKMENEIVVSKPLTAVEIREQVNTIQEIMREVMQENQHYGKIPGCGEKPTLLKPGAEKLSLTFRLRPIIDNDRDIQVEKMEDGHINVKVFCHILNSSGQELATGIGSCSTMESKYRYRGGEKTGTGQPVPTEYWNLKKAGKSSEAQALLGGREFAPGKIDGVWQICETGAKMENPDIADTHNTVLKMAKKRAYVDGILSATAASDIFTQDIEDMPAGSINVDKVTVEAVKPNVAMPKEKTTPPPPSAADESPFSPDEETPSEAVEKKPFNPISLPQSKRLYAIYKGNNYTEQEVKEFLQKNFGISSTREIEREYYDDICQHFAQKKNE